MNRDNIIKTSFIVCMSLSFILVLLPFTGSGRSEFLTWFFTPFWPMILGFIIIYMDGKLNPEKKE